MTPTVGSYLDSYLHDLERLFQAGERSPSTMRTYRDSAAAHFTELRDRPLEAVTVAEIREWHFQVAQRARDRGWHTSTTGAGSANQALVLLGLVMRRAEEDGAIPRGSSPTRFVQRFRQAPRERYLTEPETALIWSAIGRVEKTTVRHAARPKALAYSPFQALRLILLLGLRKMESLALRWDQVDLEGRLLRFKSKTGMREVALSTVACDVLREQARRRVSAWVFPSRVEGKSVQFIYRVWRKVVEVSGVDPTGLVIHTARHSLATCALRRGEALEHVSRVLGHTNTRTTQEIYSRPLATPGMRALVERQAEIVTGRAA